MRIASATLAAILATAVPTAARADDEPARFAEDAASGHRFRVAFDPASRVTLGVAATAARGPKGSPAASPEIDAGVAYRTVRSSGAGRERVSWQVEHRIASGWLRPIAGPSPGVPAFDAGLYRASILRHDASPRLVFPTSPPVGIPFPFDVGFDVEAGRVSINAVSRSDTAPMIHVGVARAALLLDPWRSGARGRLLTFGVGARYDVDVEGATARAIHRVAPMTEGSLRFRAESLDGLSVVDVRGEVAPHWSSLGAWAFLARASVRLERALLAVNDQPIAAVLEGGYRFDPKATTAPASSDFRVSLGLSLHLNLPN